LVSSANDRDCAALTANGWLRFANPPYFLRRRDKLTRRANQFRFTEMVSSPEIKNISLFPKAKSALYLSPSRSDQRGARDRHERGTGSGDEVATDERG
jgi:hypothetical protein